MSKVNIFGCDICGKEVRHFTWHDSPTSVTFEIPMSRIQKKFKADEVCLSCTEALIKGFDAALAGIKRVGYG